MLAHANTETLWTESAGLPATDLHCTPIWCCCWRSRCIRGWHRHDEHFVIGDCLSGALEAIAASWPLVTSLQETGSTCHPSQPANGWGWWPRYRAAHGPTYGAKVMCSSFLHWPVVGGAAAAAADPSSQCLSAASRSFRTHSALKSAGQFGPLSLDWHSCTSAAAKQRPLQGDIHRHIANHQQP